jgi:hypothetical protein
MDSRNLQPEQKLAETSVPLKFLQAEPTGIYRRDYIFVVIASRSHKFVICWFLVSDLEKSIKFNVALSIVDKLFDRLSGIRLAENAASSSKFLLQRTEAGAFISDKEAWTVHNGINTKRGRVRNH